MSVGRVVEIHRYPVKSMQGELLDDIHVAADGFAGDRSFAVKDEARGGIEGARKLPALLGCTARYTRPVVAGEPLPVPEIELPDGRRLAADADDASAAVSELLGQPASLWSRKPADDSEHYKRGAADHTDLTEELRAVFGRLPDEPLPDLGSFPPETLFSATVPGTYFDCYPMFMLTRASLESLAAASPESDFDARRFRPNILIESDETDGYPENDWVGQRVRIGEAVFAIAMECPRCVMTTHAFADLPKDPKIMRTLVKENNGNVGVYASIVTPGRIARGDVVELLGA